MHACVCPRAWGILVCGVSHLIISGGVGTGPLSVQHPMFLSSPGWSSQAGGEVSQVCPPLHLPSPTHKLQLHPAGEPPLKTRVMSPFLTSPAVIACCYGHGGEAAKSRTRATGLALWLVHSTVFPDTQTHTHTLKDTHTPWNPPKASATDLCVPPNALSSPHPCCLCMDVVESSSTAVPQVPGAMGGQLPPAPDSMSTCPI